MVATMLDADQLSPERVRPLRRSEYERLVEAGAFEDERVELLRGVLVEMSPQGGPHAGVSARIANLLILALGEGVEVRTHSPFAAGEDSMPEPDVMVVPSGSMNEHPSRALLLVEVAHSSLRKDRGIKAALYAEAQVPEYWIVDLDGRTVEVHTRPVDAAYQSLAHVGEDGVLRSDTLPAVAIPVAEILPPR